MLTVRSAVPCAISGSNRLKLVEFAWWKKASSNFSNASEPPQPTVLVLVGIAGGVVL